MLSGGALARFDIADAIWKAADSARAQHLGGVCHRISAHHVIIVIIIGVVNREIM